MTEEKKEESVKDAEKPKQAVAAVEGVVEAAAPKDQGAQPVKEEKKEALPEKKERPANCEGCKKSIKNKRWYYRNGKYFCTKRCWGTTNKKPAKTEEAPAPAA